MKQYETHTKICEQKNYKESWRVKLETLKNETMNKHTHEFKKIVSNTSALPTCECGAVQLSDFDPMSDELLEKALEAQNEIKTVTDLIKEAREACDDALEILGHIKASL